MYDLIGDIHGHADELVQLLHVLGYENHHGIYRHPERKVIFLGDFIDRGAQIRQVLEIVRPMVESGSALAVMGNHELNALAYHTEDPDAPGEYLRRHTPNNYQQHRVTMEQLSPAELASYLTWFRTLPIWLEFDGLRAVHACWDEQSMALIEPFVRPSGPLTNDFLHSACKREGELFDPVEIVLKGKEAALPKGFFFRDRYGQIRANMRVRWYLAPDHHTYQSYALSDDIQCNMPIDGALRETASPYPRDAKPVFVGHYWLSADRPRVLADNVACLDFSVAQGGFLCAYRWQGEQKLNDAHFVWTR